MKRKAVYDSLREASTYIFPTTRNLHERDAEVTIKRLETLERNGLYLLTYTSNKPYKFIAQFKHFYKDTLRFKILSRPRNANHDPLMKQHLLSMREKVKNKKFMPKIPWEDVFAIRYDNLSMVSWERIHNEDLPLYFDTCTQHLKDYLSTPENFKEVHS